MNKYLRIFLMFIFVYIFMSCKSDIGVINTTDRKLKIGVTTVPYGEILQNIKYLRKTLK